MEKGKDGAKIRFEVANKAESFWKRNKKKFIQAGEIILGSALGFIVGRATVNKSFFGVKMQPLEDLDKELNGEAPFEE